MRYGFNVLILKISRPFISIIRKGDIKMMLWEFSHWSDILDEWFDLKKSRPKGLDFFKGSNHSSRKSVQWLNSHNIILISPFLIISKKVSTFLRSKHWTRTSKEWLESLNITLISHIQIISIIAVQLIAINVTVDTELYLPSSAALRVCVCY